MKRIASYDELVTAFSDVERAVEEFRALLANSRTALRSDIDVDVGAHAFHEGVAALENQIGSSAAPLAAAMHASNPYGQRAFEGHTRQASRIAQLEAELRALKGDVPPLLHPPVTNTDAGVWGPEL